ncbi:MAG: protease modulator HflC [Verrucomicrobia bacterium]|nr:protease modulator HflC [Verrucomicrobiota bacterium]
MKRNTFTIVIGGLLLVIFGLLLFVFQVRQSEVAVVTRFGKPDRTKTEPGAFARLPWPIEKVHKMDQRIQNFEDRFEETLTPDGYNLLVNVYVGWKVSKPELFFPRFANGSVAEAEKSLEAIVRSAKNEIVGQHPFSHFISTDPNELKFAEIEGEMLAKIQKQVLDNNYGIEIKFLGIKKLGLPENVTQTVFERMKSERQVLVSRIENEGKEQAEKIRSSAERDSAKIIAEADAQATRIRGEGEAEAAKSFAVFQQNPELATLILKLNALEQTLKDKTTLILDQNTPPLDLLQKGWMDIAKPATLTGGAVEVGSKQ